MHTHTYIHTRHAKTQKNKKNTDSYMNSVAPAMVPSAPMANEAPPPPTFNTLAPGRNASEMRNKVGCITGCQETPHVKTWILSIGLWVLIILQLLCRINYSDYCYCDTRFSSCVEKCNSPCDFCITFFLGWIGVFLFLTIAYFSELFCCSSTNRYLQNSVSDTAGLHGTLDNLRRSVPTIHWQFGCVCVCVCLCVVFCTMICVRCAFFVFKKTSKKKQMAHFFLSLLLMVERGMGIR